MTIIITSPSFYNYNKPFCQSLQASSSSKSRLRTAIFPAPNFWRCGNDIPDPVSSSGNRLRLVLRTDASVSHRGFRARWSTDEPARKFDKTRPVSNRGCKPVLFHKTNSIFTFLSPFSNIMTRNFPGH